MISAHKDHHISADLVSCLQRSFLVSKYNFCCCVVHECDFTSIECIYLCTAGVYLPVQCIYLCPAGVPKILVDSLEREITAPVGEPYRIRVPFKGSPAPTATWNNVCIKNLTENFSVNKCMTDITLHCIKNL